MSDRRYTYDQDPSASADLMDPAEAAESMRAAFGLAFDSMGGAAALAHWGHAHPTQFYLALAKLLAGDARAARIFADVSDTPLSAEPLSVEEWQQLVQASARGRSS